MLGAVKDRDVLRQSGGQAVACRQACDAPEGVLHFPV